MVRQESDLLMIWRGVSILGVVAGTLFAIMFVMMGLMFIRSSNTYMATVLDIECTGAGIGPGCQAHVSVQGSGLQGIVSVPMSTKVGDNIEVTVLNGKVLQHESAKGVGWMFLISGLLVGLVSWGNLIMSFKF